MIYLRTLIMNKKLSLDESILLMCAFRYALGRRTYVVSVICENIIKNYLRLEQRDRDLFIREISQEMANDNILLVLSLLYSK
jgi:hypothetical protein